MSSNILNITHFDNTGLFSNCSVMLGKIIDFYNQFNSLPFDINTSNLFFRYKTDDEIKFNIDISSKFFKHFKSTPNITLINNYHFHFSNTQFSDYTKINHFFYKPFIDKFFSPSDHILSLFNSIILKYNLDFDNICVFFYRGNDKCTETIISDYNKFIQFGFFILNIYPSIKFLIQTDETEFLLTMLHHFPLNAFYFKDEIIHINKDISTCNTFRNDNHLFGPLFLAIILIISKSKIIITNTSNCSLWFVLYRNHTNLIFQDFNNSWYPPPPFFIK